MKKANRLKAGFIGGGLAAEIVNSVINKAVCLDCVFSSRCSCVGIFI